MCTDLWINRLCVITLGSRINDGVLISGEVGTLGKIK